MSETKDSGATGATEQVKKVAAEGESRAKTDVIGGTVNILADRFDGFHDSLGAEKKRKKEELEEKFEVLHQRADTLNHSLQLESKNTKNSLKAMKAWLEDRFVEFHKSIVDPINLRFEKLDDRLVKLNAHIVRVEERQAVDRKVAAEATEKVKVEFEVKLNDFKRKFNETIEGIAENHKEVQLQLREQKRELVNQLKDEREAREKAQKIVADAISAEEKVRAKGIKLLVVDIERNHGIVEAKIADETVERKAGDEKLVKAIAHYTGALQDAVKIISTQD